MKRFLGFFTAIAILICSMGIPVVADTTDSSSEVTPSPTPLAPCYEVVTVPAPTASVESGAVPYGTLVKITDDSGLNGRLMYSKNGGEWYSTSRMVEFTITEDTTIATKISISSPEPNKEYICEEVTYVYTIDLAASPVPAVPLYSWDGGVEIIPPTKTVYIEGEYLDLTGMEAYGLSGIHYSDGTNEITARDKLSISSIEPSDRPLTVEDTTVTVTGTYWIMGSLPLSGTFEITVLPASEATPLPTEEPNQAEKDYNISYYEGGIGNEGPADEIQPYGNKITSAAGLEALSMWNTELREEIIAKYDDAFFEEKFLVVISWAELQGVRLKLVNEVSVDEDDFSIVMSEREYNGEVTSVIAPYCAILEVPVSEDDKALMLDGKYFYVPPLCIEPAVEYTVTFDTCCKVQVYTDASATKVAESPYTTTDGALYFDLIPAPGSGDIVDVKSTSGTISRAENWCYVLSGVTEDAVVTNGHYTGPYLELFTQENEDGSVTAEVLAGFKNASAPYGVIMLAAYNQDGSLQSVQSKSAEYGTLTFILTDLPEEVKTFKAMWWDGMKPVIEAKEKTLE